jgi:two-component system CheB/CheR fusion protein
MHKQTTISPAAEVPTPQAEQPLPAAEPFYIVGIGASAGGLEALEQLFRNMPTNSGVGFVVIQHLSPDYKSLMVELLSKHTSMRVLRAESDMAVLPDRIYLIPPKKSMTIFDGCLQLKEKDPTIQVNLPIDIFFASLARDQGDRAIGIILSGTGSDGTRGVRAIKEAGGMIMVQEEHSAKFNGMPRSAVATGVADFILPPEEMPGDLMDYVQHRRKREATLLPFSNLSDDDTLGKIFQLVKNQTNVDFSNYKPSTAGRRIQRRLHVNRIETLADYLQHIMRTPREVSQLYNEMLIGVTNFFRDPETFNKLEKDIIPELLRDRDRKNPIRVWCSGCSTGEEAYSLAILFKEAIDACGRPLDVKIFATDIDRDSLEFASAGVFPESIAADLSQERLQRCFRSASGKFHISRQIREMVVFAPHNLINDPPFTRIDLISCRNLLIYLQPVLQKKIFSYFCFSLNPAGYLMLGSSESIGDCNDQFRTISSKWKLYQLRSAGKKGLPTQLSLAGVQPGTSLAMPKSQHLRRKKDKGEVLEVICRALIESQGKSCIVVNDQFQLTYVFGEVNDFVSFTTGAASLDILSLVPKPLSLVLSTTLHRARKENKTIFYKGVVLNKGADTRTLNVSVQKMLVDDNHRSYYFIFLESIERVLNDQEVSAVLDLQEQAGRRVNDLENDLQFSHENLQATIEELETSNEELQATNEELLSSNEELQSTNEELQSVNEELFTVNNEYQNKIQELTSVNNDIDNLLRCTDIGSTFLDKDCIIRRYTPAAAQYVNIIEKDVGRSFFDLTHQLHYKTFADDVRFVMASNEMVATEVKHKDGTPVLIKIFPYLDEQQNINGVVINFVDLSAIAKIELELLQMHKEKDIVLDYLPEAVLYYNPQLEVIWANQKAFLTLEMTAKELIGRHAGQIWQKDAESTAISPARQALEKGIPCAHTFDKGQGEKWYVQSIPIHGANGSIRAIIQTAHPVDIENYEVLP